MPKRLCNHPRCPAIVDKGYCEKHRKQKERWRGTAASRGYDRDWQRYRERYLREHPLCAECEKIGKVEPATVIHHIKPIDQGGEILDSDNLMVLCRDCHERKHGRKK